ncbi:hypothetical protein PI125_g3408 [Phytophthora idaei]|nr:hypothetical protein PI125_g3408 [Phytophthora idaei]
MAAVNAFIVYRDFRKVNNMRPPRHFAFFETLMEQLLAVDQEEASAVIEVRMLEIQHNRCCCY